MAAHNHLLPISLLSLLFFFFLTSPPALACDPGDRAVLLKIKAGFLNPGKFTSWNESTNCCTWYGVKCNPHDDGGRVTSLDYRNYGAASDSLSGRLPDELGDLPFLSDLLLANHTNVYGILPLTLTRLTRLSFLYLPLNSLSGALPSFLTQIRSLTFINLSYNKFSGLIPPEFSNFPALETLALQLAGNMLSGNIPTELLAANWATLDLSYNKLTGDPTALFAANKATTYMDLSFNKLEFDMTGIDFPVKLITLTLENNMIKGSIPAQINHLSDLLIFNVSSNQLCGIIPAGPVMDRFDNTHFFPNKCLCRSKVSCL
ncbi:Polygalacturonase inhibitor 2 [Platanthera zijinensis]|uniref:Polygalacturonase inhibitor 2 n=1 Tax=Platanthera zijinensis TaxID=2320716 RepID=A0AAP0AXK8_9ASPA